MNTRLVVTLAVLAVGLMSACGRKEEVAEPLFAPEVAGFWKLQETRQKDPLTAPPEVRRFTIRSAQTGFYQGEGGSRCSVDLYELSSDAAGLQIEQTWQHTPDTVAFHRGHYFAVVRFEGSRDKVAELVRLLGRRLAR